MEETSPVRQLCSSHVGEDFGLRARCTRQTLQWFLTWLEKVSFDAMEDPAASDYSRWRQVFGDTTGRSLSASLEAKTLAQYGKSLDVDLQGRCPTHVIFAVHSYYALLARLFMRFALEHSRPVGDCPAVPSEDASDHDLAAFMLSLNRHESWSRLGAEHVLEGDGFSWCQHIWTDGGIPAARALLGAVRSYDFTAPADQGGDILKGLYQSLVPRSIRHQLGEYYTPDWLAEHVLDRVGYHGQPTARLLDPACGSGTFLVHAIHRLREPRQDGTPVDRKRGEISSDGIVGSLALSNIAGIDVNPLAVIAARSNYVLAIRDWLSASTEPFEVPVYLADSILPCQQARDLFSPATVHRPPPPEQFDFVVGNPPWVGWETLPPDYREQLKPTWLRHGLFPHRGMAAILGQGKKDLSILMSYAASDRWLKSSGRLGFLITQSVFKNAGAGKAFRHFQIGGPAGVSLGIDRVDDMSDFQPFEEASTRTAVFTWTKGQQTEYPVPYELWQKTTQGRRIAQDAALDDVKAATRRLLMQAEPVSEDDISSAWLTLRQGSHAIVRRMLGESPYRAYEGVNTGGANGVYWVQVLGATHDQRLLVRNLTAGTKRKVREIEATIEADRVFPLLRGREIRRWAASASASIVMVQDPERRQGVDLSTLIADTPLTYQYLQGFEAELRNRAAFRRYFQRQVQGRPVDTAPFYSMFNVGEYTFAPWKVIWHRMVAPIDAAVVGRVEGKPVLPQETHAFVPCETADEAHYLCGIINSRLFNFAAHSYSQAGGKSFASPHILQHIRIPLFQPGNDRHQQIARLAASLHQNAGPASQQQGQHREDELNAAVATVWGLSASEAEHLREEYSQLNKVDLTSLPAESDRAVNDPLPKI